MTGRTAAQDERLGDTQASAPTADPRVIRLVPGDLRDAAVKRDDT